jgi:hypothetical protein
VSSFQHEPIKVKGIRGAGGVIMRLKAAVGIEPIAPAFNISFFSQLLRLRISAAFLFHSIRAITFHSIRAIAVHCSSATSFQREPIKDKEIRGLREDE